MASPAFAFPPATTADARGLVVVGGDLEPDTILSAYRSGLFPLRLRTGELSWWSPDPRGVLRPGALHVSHSLRRTQRRFEIRVDSAFEAVIDACADRAPGESDWIRGEVRDAYVRLHRLGWAHSVEAWSIAEAGREAELVGGLYGVAIGGLFSGESMFHRVPDGSKVALTALVGLLRGADDAARDDRLIDVQWNTPHMASLGAVEIPRDEYLRTLEHVLTLPLPPVFAGGHGRQGAIR